MNERIRNILTLLIKQPDMKVSQLSKELQLSKRQINYAIARFNEELTLKKLPNIVRNHSGDFSIPLEIVKLIAGKQVKEGQSTIQVFSENERVALLLMMLITTIDYISINHLTDYLKVSKNTVIEDIKKAEWLVDKYNLTIQYDRVRGYQLLGAEHSILQLLSDLVKQYLILQKEEIREEITSKVSNEEIMHFIHSMEQMLHLSYSDESIDYLQSSVRFLVNRGLQLPTDFEFFAGNVKKTPEFRMISILVSETSWQLSSSFVEWLALLFLTSNISEKRTTQEYDSDEELKKLISEMVDNFQTQTLIMIDDRETFERRILSHLRPSCFRIKYNLSLGMYSLGSLIQESNHGILIELMKELIVPIENWIGKAFPNDELDLLSYYFGFQLTNHNTLAKQKPRAVVVCRNGVMVSKLMRENLKKLFPEIHILSSFSVRDFYKFEVDYDLVFTTTALDTTINQFIIDPIMTYKEQISLRYRVLNELGFSELDNSTQELIEIIQKQSTIKNLTELREDIQAFLIKKEQDSPLENFQILPSLTYYLKPTYVQINHEQSLTWQEALKLACNPLIESQTVTQEFYLDCEKQIMQSEFSGFLGTDTCIPHTTIEHGVLKDGVSLFLSKEPIIFPNGQAIHLIFPLAFYDLTKHLRAINQIAEISGDRVFLEKLLATEDEKTIYQLLRQFT
ncbi:transcriptional antiterminator [Enterococcus sp. JM4C]|uniref:BglG family transcription antiterminator n=1 Tax=Candidatus Enterococcus huntleyi TaxID=1857217 RepID=UPI00137B0849|nr:PTS sugar transporter subunit IIA [Enterococcus sp. JM4C]KAF1297365.1 transcriptional antiterminator [Enterococcus sp. JM4C]